MKTTARKLTFKKASLISAIIAGTPFLVSLVLILLEFFIDCSSAENIFSVYPPLAWMISCIVFSWGIIRDGEHFPPIPKWVRWFLQIWTFLFIGFFLLLFDPSEDLIMPFALLSLVAFVGIVLCFHYMMWFWYLFKRSSSNTSVSRTWCGLPRDMGYRNESVEAESVTNTDNRILKCVVCCHFVM